MERILTKFRRDLRLVFLFLCVAAVPLAAPGPASAAALRVCPSGCSFTTIADALAAARNGDRILIGAGTYVGGFLVDKDVRLIGAGAGQTTISGGGSVVTIANLHEVTISGVTISGGNAELGGGILNGGGTVTVRDSTISGNGASQGGGIFTIGSLTLRGSIVSDNGALFGGGIFNQGTLTVSGTTIRDNHADSGGGIFTSFVATLKDSVVTGNTANVDGGGIQNFGTLKLRRTSVTGNTPNDCVGEGCF
jgi:hypothetical protein